MILTIIIALLTVILALRARNRPTKAQTERHRIEKIRKFFNN